MYIEALLGEISSDIEARRVESVVLRNGGVWVLVYRGGPGGGPGVNIWNEFVIYDEVDFLCCRWLYWLVTALL